MRMLTKLTAAAALTLGLSGIAHAQNTFRVLDAGYWSRVNLNTVVIYDWSMRNRYLLTFTDECELIHSGKPAKLSATWYGRIKGSFRDRMSFGGQSCYISDVEKLSRQQFASLLDDQDLQFASLQGGK